MFFGPVQKNNDHQRPSGDPFVIKSGRYKDGKLATVYRHDWTEDVYISDPKEKDRVGRDFNLNKLPVLLAVVGLGLFLLVARSAWLQSVKGDYYYSLAEGNRIRIERLEPKRGIIYDRQGRSLVRNEANFLLYIVPVDLPKDKNELDKVLGQVANLAGNITVGDIKSLLAKVKPISLEAYQPLFITDNIAYENAMRLYMEAGNWPGIFLSNKTRRYYPVSVVNVDPGASDSLISLSHILGYTGKINGDELEKFGDEYSPIDYIGKMGLEFFWENELRGKSGRKEIEVDALGKEKKIISAQDATDGHNLILSLDIDAQYKLEEILNKTLKKLKLTKASAIITNPSNGEIISMVSLPAYNNNAFAGTISVKDYQALANDPDKPLFNRVISGEYPSGSCIKPIWAAAALQEGVVNENTKFNSVGGIRIGEWFFPDWLARGHGITDVKKAIAMSINTYFYYIGGGYEDFKGLGIERLVKYGQLFGLGAQTGIDLTGEANGFLPTAQWKEASKNEKWYIGDTYHVSIGQGDLLVTPLQVAAYVSAIANGGSLYRPHLVKQILSGDDKIIRAIQEEPVRQNMVSAKNINIVRQGMRQTVTDGSARRLQSVPVAVAGKTGTAQWSTNKPNHAWFVGFAPFDKPTVAITVLIEQGGEGSSVAVPVAEEFLQWYFRAQHTP